MTAFTVMTWNVQNLFLDGEEGGPTSPEALAAKLGSLAEVIDQASPDVLAMQEVGSAAASDALLDGLAVPLPHRVLGQPDRRGIRVGYASALPLKWVRNVTLFPAGVAPVRFADPVAAGPTMAARLGVIDQMGRGALEASVEVNGTVVTLLTAHLKSKLLSFPPRFGSAARFDTDDEDERMRHAAYALYRRTAEAATLRERVSDLLDGATDGRQRAVVVLGDLNDEPQAATTQLLLGPPGSQIPIDAEGHVDLAGNTGFANPDKGDGQRLWNLTPLIPLERRATRIFAGRGEVIDHILCTRALVGPESLPVVDTITAMPLPSMGTDPTTRRNIAGSDHAAVVATFDLT